MVTANGRQMLAQRTEEEQRLINGFVVKPMTASMLYDAYVEAQSGNSSIRQLTRGRSSKRQLAGMRVLVVEDNLINQQVADELLTAEGAIVSLAANGQQGVDAVVAADPQFDVVLMDIQMPVLDGYGATHVIRKKLGLTNLPIVAMTANVMASDREACLAAGMNAHVGKPFDIAKLVSLLIRITGAEANDSKASMLSPANSVVDAAVADSELDLSTAVARMSGMWPLYVRIARDFCGVLETCIGELRELLQKQDWKAFAHS